MQLHPMKTDTTNFLAPFYSNRHHIKIQQCNEMTAVLNPQSNWSNNIRLHAPQVRQLKELLKFDA